MDADDGTAAVAEPAHPMATTETDDAAQRPELVAPQPLSSSQQQRTRDLRSSVRTPELQTTLPQRPLANGQGHADGANGTTNGTALGNALRNHPQLQHPRRGTSQLRESSPGHVPPFDWEEFEARYEQALTDMNGEEKELLEEFDQLVNYFNVWASAASAHDDERAVKRLQTRERYVRIAEQSLGQRKQHLTEVVRAFQSALALLSQP
ncbi:hypothetical protein F503_08531 [Ophiostoma piceae UAMH 11346]|uniref:Uncharacterized protein n=1 Tax=Ophiostoma piceae (strain UAMH 11346) TaxID=1262450 RepID=S3C9A0_OPHP1|nr:hypothetical protein F503_08531 [Ophiostoma piceae UAMH 11346]